MKKTLPGLILVLVLLLCACGPAAAEAVPAEDTAWHFTTCADLTEDALSAFREASEELTGADYEPVALLAKQQDVYCILCRATVEAPGAEPSYTLVYVGENGIQNIWDLWIEDHSMPKQAAEEERKIDLSVLLSDLAGVQSAEAQVAADLEALAGDEMAAFITGKYAEIWDNPDYRLYIDGKDDPSELPLSGKHAFVVLGFELENGEMREELKSRCDAAANAAKAFPDSILVCSGGATGENNPEAHTEAGLMKDYLVRNCGIEENRILTDESAMSTLENALNTFTILKEQGIETITVVTSSYHQRRANFLYETLAEIIRETEGVSISVAGNYSCEAQPPEYLKGSNDARIALTQVGEMLSRLLPGR